MLVNLVTPQKNKKATSMVEAQGCSQCGDRGVTV